MKKKILVCLTGSVATTLYEKIYKHLEQKDVEVRFVFSECAKKILVKDKFFITQYQSKHYTDAEEWSHYENFQKVLHIELAKWADELYIAPCSLNSLAKVANGLCDNLVTCIARAWDLEKPFVIAPAGNTKMWEHPITEEHLTKVENWGIKIVTPVEKRLFCGDMGVGALADIENIFKNL